MTSRQVPVKVREIIYDAMVGCKKGLPTVVDTASEDDGKGREKTSQLTAVRAYRCACAVEVSHRAGGKLVARNLLTRVPLDALRLNVCVAVWVCVPSCPSRLQTTLQRADQLYNYALYHFNDSALLHIAVANYLRYIHKNEALEVLHLACAEVSPTHCTTAQTPGRPRTHTQV